MGLWAVPAGVCLFAVARAAAKSTHPVGAILGSALLGMAALGLVNLTGRATGVVLPLNGFTAFVGVVLGAPGVVCLLLLGLL